jgi:Domain of unknown function (DUF4920)
MIFIFYKLALMKTLLSTFVSISLLACNSVAEAPPVKESAAKAEAPAESMEAPSVEEDPTAPKEEESPGEPSEVPTPEAKPIDNSVACAEFPDQKPEVFGEALAQGQVVTSLAAVTTNPDAFAGKSIFTTGVVRASCLKRGCWMEVRPKEDRGGATLTVRFKGYKFFVPLDSRGAHVAVEGKVQVTTLSADDVAHLESEGAIVAGKMPDGTAKQVQLTAVGVEMCGRRDVRP